MKSKTLTFVVFIGVVALLVLPGMVLTQGVAGRVLNRGTRQVFTGMDALQNAVDAAGPGAVLLAAGNLTETDEVDLTGFSIHRSVFIIAWGPGWRLCESAACI